MRILGKSGSKELLTPMRRSPFGSVGYVVLLLLGLTVLAVVAAPIGSAAPANQPSSGTVTVEWFGWSHYRFTSPNGKVILTNPFTSNPDSPIKPEDIAKADLIVVADGHGDEVGSSVAIANLTGASVLAPGGLNRWLIEQGIPREQVPKPVFSPGDRYTGVQGITVRLVESEHGSELGAPSATIPYGGVAGGYFITFENGWTAYFAGSSAATAEQGLWASMYKPNLAILHMGADHEPLDFAEQVKLLKTDNPNLKTVFPAHNRVNPAAGTTTVADVQAAMDGMGVGMQVTQPPLGQPVTFP
jgi:L-ascorbate metabolism protein UlaG (beta-lactamase superfamily)